MVGRHGGNKALFALRLKECRIHLGMSREALAQKLGVTAAAVGHWENGVCFPQISKRERLCKVLGTTQQDLHLPPF